jgi:tellurite resistance protein TehA-like permease
VDDWVMAIKFPKSSKPAQVPFVGLTIFIGLCGASALIGIFDSVTNKTVSEKLMSGVVGIAFTVWAVLRVLEMKKFPQKLRNKPRLVVTILILLVGLASFTEIFSSTISTSNTPVFAEKLISVMVGIGFTLWAVLRYIFGKEFEKNEA